jgi:hypothetical protein
MIEGVEVLPVVWGACEGNDGDVDVSRGAADKEEGRVV